MSRLDKNAVAVVKIDSKIPIKPNPNVLWSDSESVLAWLRKSPAQIKCTSQIKSRKYNNSQLGSI